MGSHHLPKNHIKQLEEAQRSALPLILRTMKSTPLEAIARVRDGNNTNWIKDWRAQKRWNYKIIPKWRLILKPQNKKLLFNQLQKILKQLLTQIAKQKNYDDINKLQLPSVKPQTFEVFIIENLENIFPNNYRNRLKTNLSKTNTTNNKDCIEYIKSLSNEKTMMIFTDGSALGNPEATGSGVVIKKNGP